MAKKLVGKRWFYAQGQRDQFRGEINRAYTKQCVGCWPMWAKEAYLRGWYEVTLFKPL